MRGHAAGDGDALVAGELGADDRGIAMGRPACGPISGLIDAAALHLVVVLADDPVLAGDVGVREGA